MGHPLNQVLRYLGNKDVSNIVYRGGRGAIVSGISESNRSKVMSHR